MDLHPGQARFCDAVLLRSADGVTPAYLTLAVSSGNRAGKTLGLAIAVAQATLYKIGLASPDTDDDEALLRHQRTAFEWFHFGISSDVADLLANELTALMSGTHPAQKGRGCPLTKALGAGVLVGSGTSHGGNRALTWAPALGGAVIRFRTTGERAVSQLGRDMHGISFDEVAFEPNLEFVIHEVLHMRRLSTGGQMLLIGTPSEGINAFSDLWDLGDPGSPDRTPDRLSLRMSTRDNIGYGISQALFDRMVAQMPPHLIPQNIDGHFIQGAHAFFDPRAVDAMFIPSLPVRGYPEAGHTYIQGVDPALVHDATWSIVTDLRPDGLMIGTLAQRKQGKQTVTTVANLVRDTHLGFNSDGATCDSGLDTTGMGGKVFRDMLSDIVGLRQIDFGGAGRSKQILLTDLKGMIEMGRFRFPRHGIWLELRRQLLGYRLADRKLATDAVMALAVLARVAQRHVTTATPEVTFEFFHRARETGPVVATHPPMSEREFLRGRIPSSTLEGIDPELLRSR